MKKLVVFLIGISILLAVSAGFAQTAPKPKPATPKPAVTMHRAVAPKPAVAPIAKPKPAAVKSVAAKPAAKPASKTVKHHVKAHRRHHVRHAVRGSQIRKVTPKRVAPKPAAQKTEKK